MYMYKNMRKNDYIYLFLAFILGYFAQSIIKQRCGTVIEGITEETETGDYEFRRGGLAERDTCINRKSSKSCIFMLGWGGKDAEIACMAGEYEDRMGTAPGHPEVVNWCVEPDDLP